MNVRSARHRIDSVRSKLFVSGCRPELFLKAAATNADALSFDLEDSVLQSGKTEAREAISAFLRSDTLGTSKLAIVRVNPLGSEHFQADIMAVVVQGLHVINLPKVESREDIIAAAEKIAAFEQANGVTDAIGILANIETPKGLRLAYDIATAHPRVIGLQIGFLDLSLACGIDPTNAGTLDAVRLSVRFAAAEADIPVFDGAFADVRNIDAYRQQAEHARALGLTGKSCIHPSQVAIANEVFTPKADALRQAAQIVKAAASRQESGAFLLNGSMVDAPIITRARQLITRAGRYGISIPADGE